MPLADLLVLGDRARLAMLVQVVTLFGKHLASAPDVAPPFRRSQLARDRHEALGFAPSAPAEPSRV